MANLTVQARRRGLDFANKVAELAAGAPDGYSKARLYRAVHAMRQVYGFNEKEKKQILCHWLRQGCSSYNELARESGLPRSEVTELIGKLKLSGKVDVRSLSGGSTGRPATFISLIA